MVTFIKPSKKTIRLILLSFLGVLVLSSGIAIVLANPLNIKLQVQSTEQSQDEYIAPPASLRVAVSGDFGMNVNTASTITGLAAINPDLVIALGDLGYSEAGSEAAWCSFVRERIAPEVPFELVVGNHDDGTQGNQDFSRYADCLPSKVEGLIGEYGTQNYFDYKGLARFINISPDIRQFGHNYAKGDRDYKWLINAIDGARSSSIPWIIVSMHKNCITIGEKSCEIGQDLQDLLVEKKVDLVLQGHEHGYMRTKQLALSDSCQQVTINSFSKGCVISEGDVVEKAAGTVIAIVGTGGKELRDVYVDDAEFGYFEAWNGQNTGNSYGFLDVTINEKTLLATFVKSSGGGDFSDSFIIK
jgi:hypothetical protein